MLRLYHVGAVTDEMIGRVWGNGGTIPAGEDTGTCRNATLPTKCHVDCPGTESRSRRFEAGDKPPEPWQGPPS